MTAIHMGIDGEPYVTRHIESRGETFTHREWPLQIARFRSVLENRPPIRVQSRASNGRYGKTVLS